MNPSEPIPGRLVGTDDPSPLGGNAVAMAAASHPAPRLGRQFGWVSSGRIVAALLQAFTLALLARWTTLVDFGLVSAYLSIVVIVQTVTDMGIPTLISRQRAADPNDPNIAWALRWNNVTSSAIAVLLAGATLAAGMIVSPAFLALLPLTVWAAAERNTDAWLGLALADGDARINTTFLVARRVAAVAGFWGLHAVGSPPLLAFASASCLVSVLANVWARRIMRARLSSRGRTVGLVALVRLAAPYWLNSLATQLRLADVIIAGVVAGPAQAALYAAASRTTSPLRILPTSLAAVLVPAAARPSTDRRQSVRKPVLAVLSVVCVLYGLIVVFAPVVVPLLLGADYAGAVVPLQIVVGGLIFAAAASILGAYLQGVGQAHITARAAVISTVACLIGVLVGAGFGGAIAAAIALACSFALQAAMLAVSALYVTRTGSGLSDGATNDPAARAGRQRSAGRKSI